MMRRKKEKESTSVTAHPFQRLQSELAELIASTPPGERLLAEPELAKKLGVSRATLREAMRSFEGQGLIRRRQGVGTFVVSQAKVIESGLEMLESLETMASKIGLDMMMGDLRIEEIFATAEQAAKLDVAVNSSLVKVTRTIHAAGRPVAFLIDILPDDILGKAELQDGFTGSVLDLLLQRGSPVLSNSVADIQAVAATIEVARALEIQRGDVLLMFTAQLFTADDRMIDLSASYFLPGYFRFHIVRRVAELKFSTVGRSN
jgi:GntR family transcriptional regulator